MVSISFKTKNFKPKEYYDRFLLGIVAAVTTFVGIILMFWKTLIDLVSWTFGFLGAAMSGNTGNPYLPPVSDPSMLLGLVFLFLLFGFISVVYFVKSFVALDVAVGNNGFHFLQTAVIITIVGFPVWFLMAAFGLWYIVIGIITFLFVEGFAKGLADMPNVVETNS